MATTTFSGPVVATNGFTGAVTGNVTGNLTGLARVPTYTVATAPAATSIAGTLIYVSDGAGGNPVLAFSDGTNWLRCDTLATISGA
ncbi:MAG: hypothetical protein IPI17_02330 [Nitrosomonas sp.]|nr:hypothetical protein [Nitrosomonas sp.]